jgi:hypothetical protein
MKPTTVYTHLTTEQKGIGEALSWGHDRLCLEVRFEQDTFKLA